VQAYADWCLQATDRPLMLDYAELLRDPEAVLWDFASRFELSTRLVSLAVAAVPQDPKRDDLFTAVITLNGQAGFLPHLLESLLWQTHSNWEARVFSDGENPEARAMVSDLHTKAEFAGRLTYYEGVARPGSFENHLRRLGLYAASGLYVSFLKHDTLLHPDYLRSHVENFHRGCGLSVLGSHSWSREADTTLQQLAAGAGTPRWQGSLPQVDPEYAEFGPVLLSSLAFLSEMARHCELFKETDDTRPDYDFVAFQRARNSVPLQYDSRILVAGF